MDIWWYLVQYSIATADTIAQKMEMLHLLTLFVFPPYL